MKEIGEVCRAAKVFFHTDAAQAVGKIPVDVNDMKIDLMSISAQCACSVQQMFTFCVYVCAGAANARCVLYPCGYPAHSHSEGAAVYGVHLCHHHTSDSESSSPLGAGK